MTLKVFVALDSSGTQDEGMGFRRGKNTQNGKRVSLSMRTFGIYKDRADSAKLVDRTVNLSQFAGSGFVWRQAGQR